MNQWLNPDNRFFSGIRKIVDLVWLSMLWTVCSLPVITMGAATCGLYYAVVKNIRRDRSYAAREFFRGMKDNFWQATGIWVLVLLLLTMVLIGDLPVFGEFLQMESAGDAAMCTFFFVKLCLPLLLFAYALPMISRFDMKTIAVVEKSILLSVRHILHTLALLLLLFAVLILAAAESLLVIFFLPGLYCLIASFFLEPIWRRYTAPQREKENRDCWYLE